MPTKEEFKIKLVKLIEQFSNNEAYYKSKAYKEDELRQEFINPFFKALGWDMENEGNVAPQYRDVIHEDRIEIEGKPKAPDYSFKVGSERKFFVEAKAASIKIISEFPPSFQLRRYAWSGKLPISLLTDFEEFSVYDSTVEPKQSDKVETARIKYIHYKDYLKEIDYLWDTFSKDAVWKGSFDKFAKSTKRGTELVDKKFLNEIETWRNLLAKDIASNNEDVDIYQLNEAVQKIIDRIIFLRIAEDRGIEFYETLKKTIESKDTYSKLVQIFKRAQEKYNSNLFDFEEDKLTPRLKISDKVLDRIIGTLYYPKSPYEFSVIGVEILGSVYEQFLGKVIRLTKQHNAIIEEKPEVKKAGGVYYTPQYIVDYIVRNTVGELVKGKTPKKINKLRIVDPACGSGSFLIGAYNFLLDWHLKYYIENDTEKHLKSKALFKDSEGNYLLSTAEKKRILLNNIFGVDIDAQAVEVTKLSLALKMLENESSETINTQMKLFAERILPDLGSNIKCGNSLIGSDYYNDKNLSLLDDEEIRKVNVFDWEKEFSEIFKQGGFDVVIGNPPYIPSYSISEDLKSYIYNNYQTAEYQINTYPLFVEKSLRLIKKNAYYSYIVPNYWLSNKHDKQLRRIVFLENKVLSILNTFEVFENATVDTLILIGCKSTTANPKVHFITLDPDLDINSRLKTLNSKNWHNSIFQLITPEVVTKGISFSKSIELKGEDSLSNFVELKKGMQPYELGKGNPSQTKQMIRDKIYNSDNKIDDTYLPLIKAGNIKRYEIVYNSDQWIKYGQNLAAPRNPRIFSGLRLLVSRIISKEKLLGTITKEDFISNTDVIVIRPKENINEDLFKILSAIILSRTATYYLKANNISLNRKAFPKINVGSLSELPIPTFNSKSSCLLLVDKILSLKNNLKSTTRLSADLINDQINKVESEIDQEVYKLYGLNKEEIQIIENKTTDNV